MASKRKRASSSHPRQSYDSSHFVSEEAWDRYQTNVHLWNILPKRNIELAYLNYDEFLHKLVRRHWHRHLTYQMENRIDVALVKEFYTNLYDPEDLSPRQCKVRGKLIRFDATTLNSFLETPVAL